MLTTLILDTLRTPDFGSRARPTGLLRFLRTAARNAWIRARDRRELAALDAAALRDIGIDRSEFESCWLEAEGGIEATRLRIARLALRDARLPDR